MNSEKKFSVYLFITYRKLSVKIADYANQLAFNVLDGYSTPLEGIQGVAIVDDQIPSDLFHKLLRSVPILSVESNTPPHGPCHLFKDDLSLSDFAKLVQRVSPPPAPLLPPYWLASNPSSQEVQKRIHLASTKNCSVLILGESGTGKEIVARAVHQLSLAKGLFVAVNCGAIPADLVESELFGHEKGAFTGAIAQRLGKCEVSANGTLFLDEIGDMPLATQVKLLRVLQELSFERLGSSRPIPLTARIVSATHQALPDLVRNKTFREDLFYRLNVLPIILPPLRTYPLELPDLIAYLAHREGLNLALPPKSLKILQEYPWPGNIRQLLNILKRLDLFYPNTPIPPSELLKMLQSEPLFSSVGPSFA